MSVDFIGLLVYAIVLRAMDRYELGMKAAVSYIVVLPFVITKLYQAIILSIHHAPLSQLVSLADIVITLLQIPAAVLVVALLRRNEESVSAWLGYSVLGGVLSYMLLPYMVGLFLR